MWAPIYSLTGLFVIHCPQARSGTALSLDMALWSGARMASPMLGAWLLSTAAPGAGAAAIGSASAALMAALIGAVHLGLVDC